MRILASSDVERLGELVPLRYQRMATSPFAYLRGSAAVMAHDVARGASTGLKVQLCGDAHVANFGVFATPERHLVFDINDFDETGPGPFEWDVKRLAASCVVAGRDHDMGADATGLAVVAVRAYCDKITELAALSTLEIWYSTIDVGALVANPTNWDTSKDVARRIEGSATRTNLRALDQLTETVRGRTVIIDDPPLVEHIHDTVEFNRVRSFHDRYRASLPEERRVLLDRFEFVDAARKVVGIGSVGTRCYLVLLQSIADREPMFLQLKQALPSALQRHLRTSTAVNDAQRIVNGQHLLQSATDPMLGWAHEDTIDLYVRQLWDRKGGLDVHRVPARTLTGYVRLCGAALARAHARSSHPALIAGYLGKGRAFTTAIAAFATAYADQTDADHTALTEHSANIRSPDATKRRS